jgi:pimeloyl-ACP methyl ester carboxylesterase
MFSFFTGQPVRRTFPVRTNSFDRVGQIKEFPMNIAFNPKIYKHVHPEQINTLLRFRAGHPHKHLLVQGVDWSYLDGGGGQESIVFLPGGLGLAEAWFQMITTFDRDYRTLAFTYPPVSTMKELSDGIAAVLDAEGIRQAHFLGTSMGGMLAQCFVRQYPDKVDRLILANTAPPDKANADHLEQHNRQALKYPMWLIRWASVRSLDKHMTAIPAGESKFWKAYFKESIYTQWDRESISCQGQCTVDYARNYEFKPSELAGMEDRILIIESDDDLAIRPELGAVMHNLYPGAHLHTFHNAGHIPMITRHEEYVALIREFLQRN